MESSPQALYTQIAQCMLRDQPALRRRLRGIERTIGSRAGADPRLQVLAAEVTRARQIRDRRQARVPKPTYPEDLPVAEHKDQIAAAITANQVVVICGETGSGKSTQLPKICLELGRGVQGLIGHTQPRRVAARSLAMRIAHELGSPLGQAVGYKVRFSDHVSDDTYVKLMTDGILLAETQGDGLLYQYDTIIIDEAHERSLNIDFLLGYLKQLLPKRPDLKLIITSATIDPERFSRHFNNAPVVEVSGRIYPVEVRYRPLVWQDSDERDLEQIEGIVKAIDELSELPAGDVLVFLSGEREIRETAEALRKHHPADAEILPLYARLSSEDQMKVFGPHTRRRIILATNVAETSLTVPGIRHVVDTGVARISRYSPRTKVQRLPIEAVSRASADQRKGRCGRLADGVCIRLYSEADYASRPQFTEPEILRTHLASVILQMKYLNLGDIQEFPFVEPPDYRQVRDGYMTLHELGAIDEKNQLTELGRKLAHLPIDPRIARMVLAAIDENCLSEVLIIASALSVQEARERPMDKEEAADQAHAQFRHETSDFLSYLKLWNFFHSRAKHLSGSKLRSLCRENFISFVRMREWHDVHEQLQSLIGQISRPEQNSPRPRQP